MPSRNRTENLRQDLVLIPAEVLVSAHKYSYKERDRLSLRFGELTRSRNRPSDQLIFLEVARDAKVAKLENASGQWCGNR